MYRTAIILGMEKSKCQDSGVGVLKDLLRNQRELIKGLIMKKLVADR
jgi:hypothetical protein